MKYVHPEDANLLGIAANVQMASAKLVGSTRSGWPQQTYLLSIQYLQSPYSKFGLLSMAVSY